MKRDERYSLYRGMTGDKMISLYGRSLVENISAPGTCVECGEEIIGPPLVWEGYCFCCTGCAESTLQSWFALPEVRPWLEDPERGEGWQDLALRRFMNGSGRVRLQLGQVVL